MKQIRAGVWAALFSAVLVACGGSDPHVPGSGEPSGAPTTKGTFGAVVAFGDSLTDVGTYGPASSLSGDGQPPFFGGKFTTNGATGTVWVENLATSLGLAVTPAEIGFAGSSVACPAAAAGPVAAATCTGYAQGGARVTDPNGIGKTGGALTVPVKTQIANHLARFTSFKDSDLIVVWAGNNDVFIQFGAFSAQALQIQADAAAGRLSADAANKALFEAQNAAQAEVKKAAVELAGYVKSEILAKGGRYVAVINLPDSSLTPFGLSLPATAKPVLSAMVDNFNTWLREGLSGLPVALLDQNTLGKDVAANPAKYGFVNSTVPACDAAKIQLITAGRVTDGSSLFCNATAGAPFNGLRDGADVTTWQFADGVHLTTGGNKVISDTVVQQLRALGWI